MSKGGVANIAKKDTYICKHFENFLVKPSKSISVSTWRQNIVNLLSFDPMELEMDILLNYRNSMAALLKQGENLPLPSTESIMAMFCYQNIEVKKLSILDYL